MPTLKDLCGISTTNKLEGTSFTPLLTDPKRPWKKGAFTWFGNKGQHLSVRTQHHKYAEWVHRGERIKGTPGRAERPISPGWLRRCVVLLCQRRGVGMPMPF